MLIVSLGRFVWYDLMTPDPDAAVAYYTQVAGWGTEKWKTPEGMPPYTMWTVGGAPLGGVMGLPAHAGAPPHWLGYVSTPDVDASVAKVTAHGGSMMVPPTPIPTVGRFAVATDPTGAMFALFTPEAATPGHHGPPRPGDFSWHELATTDRAKALAFYSAVFGWETLDAMDMGPSGIYQMFGLGGVPMGGIYTIMPEHPMPTAWTYYLSVDDIVASTARVTAAGGKVVMGPHEIPGGDMITMALDPQGAMFALHAPKSR